MIIDTIIKRNNTRNTYVSEKITNAILKAMLSVNNGELEDAQRITNNVEKTLLSRKKSISNYVPNVEEIQDLVEQKLMQSEFLDVAKSFIIYRNQQAQRRKRNIFEKRLNLKPYEYPELYEYVSAIRHSYWIHSELKL